MLFERSALSKQPELTIQNDLEKLRSTREMSPAIAFKDPYILDFLGLANTYSEKDLEQAIIVQLQEFILELGNDLIAQQGIVTAKAAAGYFAFQTALGSKWEGRRINCLRRAPARVATTLLPHFIK